MIGILLCNDNFVNKVCLVKLSLYDIDWMIYKAVRSNP